jgi:hypothetical protein
MAGTSSAMTLKVTQIGVAISIAARNGLEVASLRSQEIRGAGRSLRVHPIALGLFDAVASHDHWVCPTTFNARMM